MGTTMNLEPHTQAADRPDRERGAAIIIALMVSLILAFLGLGLLLQTSLGLQAAGTDRWVVRSLYAADAGTQLAIATMTNGAIASGTFTFTDDPNVGGFMSGVFNVTISDVCRLQPEWDAFDPLTGDTYPPEEFKARSLFFRSHAQRDAGGLVGLTQATITQDVMVLPVPVQYLFPPPPDCS